MSMRLPTGVEARLDQGRELLITPARAIRAPVGPGRRALTAIPAVRALGDANAVAAAVLRARALGGGAFLTVPVPVEATGSVSVNPVPVGNDPWTLDGPGTGSLGRPLRRRNETDSDEIPDDPGEPRPPRPGPVLHDPPVAADGSPELAGQPGVNVVLVAVSDGRGQRATQTRMFFLSTETTAAPVVVERVEFAPPGPDWQGEYALLRSNSGADLNLTGWTLRDLARHIYRFPDFTLRAGATLRVWTGPGVDDESNLYWGRRAAVWNNQGDTAVLSDETGGQVHRRTLGPGGR
jgi:hypothetical protein